MKPLNSPIKFFTFNLLPVLYHGVGGAVGADSAGPVAGSLVEGEAVVGVPPVIAGRPGEFAGGEGGEEVVEGPGEDHNVVHVAVKDHDGRADAHS